MVAEAPWLDLMLADLGTKELAGKDKNNPKILGFFADCGHKEVVTDETAWCAATVGSCLARAGFPLPPTNVNLMARSYLTYGVALDAPKVGCIGIWPRGDSWQGHVGIVTKVNKTSVTIIAGNQGNAISYGVYAIKTALGWRWPVAATVRDLKDAGSTTLAATEAVKKGLVVGGATTGAVGAAQQALMPAPADMTALPSLDDLKTVGDQVGVLHKLMEGCGDVVKFVLEHPWIVGLVLGGVLIFLAVRRIEQDRLARAKAGQPLSNAGGT
jgi:uncharacterized protein (TIGR02594 family)